MTVVRIECWIITSRTFNAQSFFNPWPKVLPLFTGESFQNHLWKRLNLGSPEISFTILQRVIIIVRFKLLYMLGTYQDCIIDTKTTLKDDTILITATQTWNNFSVSTSVLPRKRLNIGVWWVYCWLIWPEKMKVSLCLWKSSFPSLLWDLLMTCILSRRVCQHFDQKAGLLTEFRHVRSHIYSFYCCNIMVLFWH